MVRHLGGYGMQQGQFSRCDQGYQCARCAVRRFCSWNVSEIFASSADYREVMGITLNQSLLISSSGHVAPKMA